MIDLPAAFVKYTRSLFGEELFAKFSEALSSSPPVSLRLNPFKWKQLLLDSEAVPWAKGGFYLQKRPAFTFDPLFHAGCYYVQEASSMFLARVIDTYISSPCIALDLCAAPGGKSTHLSSLLPEGSLLVSNEVIRQRAQVLAENMIKWGHSSVVVTQNEVSDFIRLPHFFDLIVADVPCSGEGMFRKDAGAISEWSETNVEVCWKRQRDIVRDIWHSLKPGGLFVYSTCTYNCLEDEENVHWIMEEYNAELLSVAKNEEWGITADLRDSDSSMYPLDVYHFIPGKSRGEGFFVAVLRKPFDSNAMNNAFSDISPLPIAKKGKGRVDLPLPKQCLNWVRNTESYSWELREDLLVAFPKHIASHLDALRRNLRVLHAGVSVAELKGRDWTPHHSLSMSSALSEDVFHRVELPYNVAVSYLRREALVLDSSVPKGFVLVCYRGIPLGFVKNIGNRANNFYPQEWRIRSGHMPEEEVQVL